MKILFTSVGRRVELMQAFRNAADKLNIELLIYGADVSDDAPALFFCDRQISICRISDPAYIPQLINICQREQIDALIPTIDTDLLLLAQNKHRFGSTRVVISDEDMVRICRDKRLTAQFFLDCGLKTPMPVDDVKEYDGSFPCFIKPLDGSSSINAYKVMSKEELFDRVAQVNDYIIQPFIDGREYTIDAFCDFEGKPILITPRERIAVRSGEVLKTKICQDQRMIDECKAIIEEFKPAGAITVQLIRQESTGDDFFIEINPRYGGGAPLSIKAGADSAKAMLEIIAGQSIDYQEMAAVDFAAYSRFDQSVCTSSGNVPTKAVVFDLDDTLYSEKEYVYSGYEAVAEAYPHIIYMRDKLWKAFEDKKPAFDTVLKAEGIFSESLLSDCVTIYRSHKPDIHLNDGVIELFKLLHGKGIKIGILTDGRPEGQRNKIAALGLESLVDAIVVTDEIGGASFRKPCDIPFRIIQRKLDLPFEEIMYVGDNPWKDFIAPNKLGMKSLWYKNPDRLYDAPCTVHAITCIAEVLECLQNTL